MEAMHPTRVRLVVSVGLIALGAFFAGIALGGRAILLATPEPISDAAPEGIDLAPVWKAWHLLEERYVPTASATPRTIEDRVYGMVSGLAASYGDPYTVFMPPQEARSFEEDIRGTFGGVGMEIGIRESLLTVIAPLKGTPAERAGIRAGDIILAIDGTSTVRLDIDSALRRIRGDVGTPVVLTIAHEGSHETAEVTIVRDTISIPTLDTTERPDGITVLSLYNFGGTAEEEMRRALRTFERSGRTKLILDLRGNPGGYLDGAVEIASWFLEGGTVVVTEDYGTKHEPIVHRSKGYHIIRSDWRVAVLVDEGSASASEILAGALYEHGVATLVGSQTFGKGSVQELVDVTPDTSLKITVARWLTPNGVSISEAGLTPDIVVDRTYDDVVAKRDPQLDAAVRYLTTGERGTSTATTSPAR